jgi:hypothetical protein
MAGFLYFRPQQTKNVSPDDVKAWGLSYAFEQPPESRVCHNNTPTKTAGIVFADGKRQEPGNVKMDMENQVWRKMPRPGQQDIYVGYWKESPPGPGDLARANQLSGYSLRLADGSEWLVPVVRLFDEASGQPRSNLPSYLDIDENGKTIPGQVMPLYAHLWDLTAPFAEQMMSEGGPEVSRDDIYQAARTLLQVNYVVDMIEIVQAHLLTTEQLAHNIVAVAVDWPTYLRWREVSKKKTPSPVTVAG